MRWERCAHVDRIITLEDLVRAGGEHGPSRIENGPADAIVHVSSRTDPWRGGRKRRAFPARNGTSHRWWNWFTCNERVDFSRKRSDLHEAQLNIKLLERLARQCQQV